MNAATNHLALKQVVMVCAPTQSALDVFECEYSYFERIYVFFATDT